LYSALPRSSICIARIHASWSDAAVPYLIAPPAQQHHANLQSNEAHTLKLVVTPAGQKSTYSFNAGTEYHYRRSPRT
jgi:hypothetical protein